MSQHIVNVWNNVGLPIETVYFSTITSFRSTIHRVDCNTYFEIFSETMTTMTDVTL